MFFFPELPRVHRERKGGEGNEKRLAIRFQTASRLRLIFSALKQIEATLLRLTRS